MKRKVRTCDICGQELRWARFRLKPRLNHWFINSSPFPEDYLQRYAAHCTYDLCENCTYKLVEGIRRQGERRCTECGGPVTPPKGLTGGNR